MELFPGLHCVPSDEMGAKVLNNYMLLGERTVLLDTGMTETPRRFIGPYLESQGRSLSSLDLVIISHADVDHFGGNWLVRPAAPGALFLCHELDRAFVESNAAIIEGRYTGFYPDHGLKYGPDLYQWLRDAMGPATPVDGTLRGGERFRLGPDWYISLWHTPGHTAGHLSVFDERSRVAIVFDALLGRGEFDFQGRLFAPPTYLTVTGYLGSIQAMEVLQPRTILRSHISPIEGADVAAFLQACRDWVAECEAAVLDLAATHPDITLREMIPTVNQKLGPYVVADDLAFALSAHLKHLVGLGLLAARRDSRVLHYRRA